mmetsp:Transcript_23567/g.58175  ORF Transcript_23567/g.58175 Transcript_23567/m.58175 type:complete len:200 (+) Transcript_23567:216-815(+)
MRASAPLFQSLSPYTAVEKLSGRRPETASKVLLSVSLYFVSSSTHLTRPLDTAQCSGVQLRYIPLVSTKFASAPHSSSARTAEKLSTSSPSVSTDTHEWRGVKPSVSLMPESDISAPCRESSLTTPPRSWQAAQCTADFPDRSLSSRIPTAPLEVILIASHTRRTTLTLSGVSASGPENWPSDQKSAFHPLSSFLWGSE